MNFDFSIVVPSHNVELNLRRYSDSIILGLLRRHLLLASLLLYPQKILTCAFAYIISKAYGWFGCCRHVWLIGERYEAARDNGYHLFKYIRTHHPECNIHYVIGKGARDVDRIRSLGNIVYYNSFRHYVLYFLADKLIGTHARRPQPDFTNLWPFSATGAVQKRAYIKHGIIKDIVPFHKTVGFADFHLFVCGAKPEYDFIVETCGYPKGTVQYLGLARFDALHDCSVKRKQLLLMPTWRRWFGKKTSRSREIRLRFTQSDYFLAYNRFLNDPRLDDLLRNHGMNLVFYLHHQMQEFASTFSVPSDHVVVACENESDIQQLLKESAMLITDYSSVAFDFAYMHKPVIYYQFDEESYYLEHYARGYFEYDRDGFGPVARTLDELIAQVRTAISSDFSNPPGYLERADRFFPLHDTDNCERNYEAIRSM